MMIIHFYFQCALMMMMMMMMMMNILTSGGLSFIECLLAEVLQKAVSIAFSARQERLVIQYLCK